MKKVLSSLVRISISLFFIILLLYIMRDTYPQILATFKKASITMFVLGFGVFIGAVAVASLRLKLIIDAQEITITFFEALSLTFIGYFFNNFLPTSIGGDVVKAYYLSRKTDKKIGSFASVLVDRAIGLFTMIFMAFVALFFVGYETVDPAVRYLIYAITIFSLIAMVFMTNRNFAKRFSIFLFLVRPIEHKLRSIYDVIHRYQYHKALMWKSFVISIVSQALFFLSLGMLALSIGSYIPLKEIFIRMPIISSVSLLPSVNGLGLREGSTVVLFGPLIGKESAFAVSILWLLILLATSVIGGVVYGLSPQFKIRLKEVNGGVC